MSSADYESDALLSQYLLLHYGRPQDVLPHDAGPHAALDYPARCVTDLIGPDLRAGRKRALDIGCAVGRSSFELARFCDEVVGIDLSSRFIETAQRVAADGTVEGFRIDEGDLRTPLRFAAPDGVDRGRVTFEVGDACALRDDLGSFDIVLNANLIDRLPDPAAFLGRVPGLVHPGGLFVLTSPFTWLDEFTPRAKWLGGFEHDGRAVQTWDTLCGRLDPDFTLLRRTELPFLIREHARKFQWSVACAGVWQRRVSP